MSVSDTMSDTSNRVYFSSKTTAHCHLLEGKVIYMYMYQWCQKQIERGERGGARLIRNIDNQKIMMVIIMSNV